MAAIHGASGSAGVVRRGVAAVAAALAVVSPAVALACPMCATKEQGGPLGTVALGALIVAPWFAAGGIGWWIRRGILEETSSNESQTSSGSETNE